MFYLIGSLFLLLSFMVLLIIRPDLKRQGLIPALLFTPYGPISEVMFFRDYWLPEPVLPSLVVSGQILLVEDVIFAFAIVGLMSICYDVGWRKRPIERVYRSRVPLAVTLSILALLLFLAGAGLTSLNSIIVSAVVATGCALPMILVRRDLLRVALSSSLLVGTGTFCFYVVLLSIPGGIDYLVSVWKLPLNQAALNVWGLPIPATEVIWAGSTTVYFSIVYKFAVGSGYR